MQAKLLELNHDLILKLCGKKTDGAGGQTLVLLMKLYTAPFIPPKRIFLICTFHLSFYWFQPEFLFYFNLFLLEQVAKNHTGRTGIGVRCDVESY